MIEVKVRVTPPLLLSVTGRASEVVPCVVVGKATLVALSLTEGAALPVPVSVTFCGEPDALSVMLMLPESVAAEAGSKAT